MLIPAFRKAGLALLTVASLGVVSGCVALGGNVKGSFACKAPDGTCAPSMAIDDGALASIGKEAGGDLVSASAFDTADRASQRPVAFAENEPVAIGTSGKVLRIVFPAHVDRFGRLHDKTSVQTVVSTGTAALSGDAIAFAAQSPGLLGAAESAPEMFADLAGEKPAVAGIVDADAGASAPATVASAPLAAPLGGAASPMDDIKTEVAEKIQAARVVRRASSFPGKVE